MKVVMLIIKAESSFVNWSDSTDILLLLHVYESVVTAFSAFVTVCLLSLN